MKQFITSIFVIGFFISLAAVADETAQESHIITDNDAYIVVCPKNLFGCAHTIVIDDKSYKISPVTAPAKDSYQSIIGSHQFHNVRVSAPGQVSGYIVTQKGYFPNPTVEFEVFKAFELNIPVPKGIER